MSAAPTHAPDLWFEDGNVVLQAEQTVFKVFKSVLCRESVVFADILSLPASNVQDTYEGQPLVAVQEIAEDMTAFLASIFNHWSVLLFDECRIHNSNIHVAGSLRAYKGVPGFRGFCSQRRNTKLTTFAAAS